MSVPEDWAALGTHVDSIRLVAEEDCRLRTSLAEDMTWLCQEYQEKDYRKTQYLIESEKL